MGVQINGDTGNVIATKGTFSGDVGIGGTLTYEDVTNIDAVGLITARSGIEIGARPGVAASISVDGNAIFSGVTTIGTPTNGRIDVLDTTDGALNATFTRGQDTNFQLQFRNHRTSNDAVSGVGSFGVFRGANDIVGLSFMRGIGASGAGSLGVTQAGVEKVRVYYNGHVGIGSTQPVKQFVVNTAAGTNGGILVQPAAAYANNTDRAYLIVGTDGWTGANTNWNTFGFQHKIKSSESGIGRVTIDTQAGEAFSVDNQGNVGIGTVTQLGKLAIGKATGGYMNNHGLVVNRPHSIGLKNGVLVYNDTGYNPTASYRAAAFKAVGTTGNALGISTDQGSNGLGGTLTARIDFSGGAYFLGDVGIGADSPVCPLQITKGSSGDGTVTFLELNHGGNDLNDAVKLNFARAGGDAGSIVLQKVNNNNTTDFIFNTRLSNTVSESMRITGVGQLLIGGHSSPYNSNYKIDIQADTTTHLHGLSVRASALQNDTFCLAALSHVTPSGASTQRRAHIGCYRNGSSQPGGYVYMSQQDGGNTYIWPDSSNVLRISNSSSNVTNDAGTVVGSQTSDIRLKNVLGDVTYGLAEINKINPIQFNFKNDKNVQKRIGFSAQDLQSIIPESVYNTKNTSEVDGVEIEDVLGMEYAQITPVLVNAVKELSTEIDKLKAEIAALKSS